MRPICNPPIMDRVGTSGFAALSLANNHVNDAGNFEATYEELKRRFSNVQFFGTIEKPYAEFQLPTSEVRVIVSGGRIGSWRTWRVGDGFPAEAQRRRGAEGLGAFRARATFGTPAAEEGFRAASSILNDRWTTWRWAQAVGPIMIAKNTASWKIRLGKNFLKTLPKFLVWQCLPQVLLFRIAGRFPPLHLCAKSPQSPSPTLP